MNELALEQVLIMHRGSITAHGGAPGVKNERAILSALARPMTAVSGHDVYRSLPEKAAALCYSLDNNHGFHDGNKRFSVQSLNVF